MDNWTTPDAFRAFVDIRTALGFGMGLAYSAADSLDFRLLDQLMEIVGRLKGLQLIQQD